MKYKFILLDMCMSDYFNGYHDPVLTIPIWKEMTKADLTDAIISDYNMIFDYLCDEGHDNPWPDLNENELKKMADVFILIDKPFEKQDIPSEAEGCDDTCNDVMLHIICEEVV